MNFPAISKTAFWDIAFEQLDYEKSSLFIMQKVFNYGTWNDQVAVFSFYGKERVRKEIINAPYLRPTALSFLAVVLELDKTEFKCYIHQQLNPIPWTY
jgi:hypothetical protein